MRMSAYGRIAVVRERLLLTQKRTLRSPAVRRTQAAPQGTEDPGAGGGVEGRTPDTRTGHVYSNPVINWRCPAPDNFLGAPGTRLNLRKIVDVAKFPSNCGALPNQQRE
jgi:hypothetical protein